MQGLVSKAKAFAYSGAALVLLSTWLVACGDDDETPDGGMDGGEDASKPDDGGFIRPPDAQGTGGDPIPQCDRFDPDACGPGQRCHLLIRRLEGQEQFLIYPGCVEDSIVRGEGDPCDPWGGGTRTYMTEGLEDEVYVDPCADGLYCAPNLRIRGHYTCQRACETGRIGCSGEGEYCYGDPRGLEQFCRASDGCNPTDPNACGEGAGCYLRLDDRGTGVLTVCLPTVEDPLADGASCGYLNDCRPGSSCWGSSRLPPDLWTELTCQRSCTVGLRGGDDDAGVLEDDDAGVPSGSCGGGRSCEPLSESGLDLRHAGTSLGQCE